ncbi:hypothetical protein JXM83_02685 [Candidatus Woesearchaeota archaeon]|nr:hypothetical protein [Candidatus Woesearchaeota archaeon]
MGKNTIETLKSQFLRLFANVPVPLRNEIIAIIDKQTFTWLTANLEIRNNGKYSEKILKSLEEIGVLK